VTHRLRLDPHPPVPRVPVARAVDALARDGFRTPVRGHAFAARPPDGLPADAGRDVRLVREPANPRDALAVAVWIAARTPWRVGYLDRAVAARLAPRLDAGERLTARLDGWVDAPGGWRRPLLAIGRVPEVAAGGLWGRPPASTRRVIHRPAT
jgi:hypothetical protein